MPGQFKNLEHSSKSTPHSYPHAGSMVIHMGFAQTAALGGTSTCTDEWAQSCSCRFVPRDFAETPR